MDYFRNSYRYAWKNTDSLASLKLYLNGQESHQISFEIPQLFCQGCYGSDWTDLFEMNTNTSIFRYETQNGVIKPETKTLIISVESGATFIRDANNEVYSASNGTAYLRRVKNDIDYETGAKEHSGFSSNLTNFAAIAKASPFYINKNISFNTTILTEDEIEGGKDYYYTIDIVAKPMNASGMLQFYECSHYGVHDFKLAGLVSISNHTGSIRDRQVSIVNADLINISTSFYCKNMAVKNEGGPFLMKGVKYNCYQLLRKAMLTVDTQIFDNNITGLDENYLENGELDPNNIQYPIIVESYWKEILKSTAMYETVLETKNLWEVLLQIKKYIHAEPYLKFADDNTDRFVLSFVPLGSQDKKEDKSQKITIFNSRNLSEYFSSFDSYVTNLFSPQNLVEEWIVAKSGGNDYLIYNDSAILETSYQMTEVVEFDICYNGVWKNALAPTSVNEEGKIINISSKLFESSVYQILTSEHNVSPSKADSLYFKMGDTKIAGLNYVPPSVNNDQPMALKKIVRQLFGVQTDKLKFNDLLFHIKYRTQDSARITQVRPNIEEFMCNSSLEKYPHHEQFYGETDKITDSERFGENLFGRLIACGNAIYQTTQFCDSGEEMQKGELYEINGKNYYVISVENEYYNIGVFQKVTFSQDYNQISQVCSIPSENRIYDLMPHTTTRRDTRQMEFLTISTTPNVNKDAPVFLNNLNWKEFIKNLIFRQEEPILPNFAYLKFQGDKKRVHRGSFNQYVELNELYPSCEVDRTDPNSVKPKSSSSYADCIVPLLHFPKKDSIVFEWDMADNFKAKDYVDETISGELSNGNGIDNAYLTQQPLRYADILGRGDVFNFKFFNKKDWNHNLAQQSPRANLVPKDEDCFILIPDPKVIGLDKDCREAISGNCQINLLHKPEEDDLEDFITFPNIMGRKNNRLKMCLCNNTRGMFDTTVKLGEDIVVADEVEYNLVDDNINNQIKVQISIPDEINVNEVNSIILYDIDKLGNKEIYLCKNVSELNGINKLRDWFIYAKRFNKLDALAASFLNN